MPDTTIAQNPVGRSPHPQINDQKKAPGRAGAFKGVESMKRSRDRGRPRRSDVTSKHRSRKTRGAIYTASRLIHDLDRIPPDYLLSLVTLRREVSIGL